MASAAAGITNRSCTGSSSPAHAVRGVLAPRRAVSPPYGARVFEENRENRFRSRSLTVTWPPPVRLSTPHASPANGNTDQGSAWGRIEAMTAEADAPRYASRWGLHPLSVVRSARTGAPSRRFRSQGVVYRSICAGARIYDLGGVLKLLEAACELLGHMPVGALGGWCRRRSGRRRSRSWSRPTARRGVFMSAWRRAKDPYAGCAPRRHPRLRGLAPATRARPPHRPHRGGGPAAGTTGPWWGDRFPPETVASPYRAVVARSSTIWRHCTGSTRIWHCP